ncbi:MAG: hypothetical protein HW389_94 [Bacteroidetes bacterium]|nr:hypothetical protein [Bacteroidota bacterium]
MRYSWCTVLLILLISLTIPALLFAGNGKISGTVKDASNKDAVVGANVVIVGTTMGAATDPEGRYYILNVPPGTYTVQASVVGYARTEISGVQVRADQTTDLNFELRQETIELKEVVVQAQMRVVDKSQTSSKSTIGKDELSNKLPISGTLEILNTTPGAFKGFIRGGKITETKTIVDGVDVSDQYYAIGGDQANQGILTGAYVTRYRDNQLSTSASVNFNSVEQLSVNTGAVGADNASATAGLINYSLREGRGKMTGSFSARSSQPTGLKYDGPDLYWNDQVYLDEKGATLRRLDSMRTLQTTAWSSARVALIARDSTKGSKYTYSKGKYLNQDSPQIEVDGMISGSINDDWGFLLSGKYFDTHGRLPNERERQADFTFKTTYNLGREFKLNAFAIVNDKGKLFGWKNSYYNDNARLFLEGVPKSDGVKIIGSLKATHVLSPSTFYEVQLSQTYRNDRMGYSDDNGDGIASLNEDGDFLTLEKTTDADKYISRSGLELYKFFRVGNEQNESMITQPMSAGNTQIIITRPQFYYENTTNTVNTVKFDITSQVDFHNQLKGGISLRFHDISKVQRNSTLGADATDVRRRLLVEKWEFKPTEYGVYLQDRMEYAGLVINLGARLDRWDPKAADWASYYNLFLNQQVYVDDSVRADLIPIRAKSDVEPYYFFSPRIGVSHPISDEAAMYFSYSRNFIPPPFSRLYASYNEVLGSAGGLPQYASLRQEPVRSSNYELGAQWEFIPRKFGFTFTAYMRDIENYSQNQISLFLANGQNAMWISSQYADARGVEFGIQALRQTYFDFLTLYGRVNYTYSYVKASGWVGNDPAQQSSFSRPDTLKYGQLLPFDDFWSYNKVQNDVSGGNNLLTGGYDRAHRISYVLFLEFPYQVMLSSIGTFQSGFYYPLSVTADPRVAGRELGKAPWNKMVDLRIEKGFTIENIRFAVFFDMKNLFAWKNIIGYDNSVSGAQLWEYSNAGIAKLNDGTPDPTGTYRRAVAADGSPFYDIPREYYFGVRIDF